MRQEGKSSEECEAAAFDRLAEAGDPTRAFLRWRWFAAGAPARGPCLVLRGDDGEPLAALALRLRSKGPFSMLEVGGGYWPFRGIPLAPSVNAEALANCFGSAARTLGTVWRVGPVLEGDRDLESLRQAVSQAGWHVLVRRLGRTFELDLAALKASGTWPSVKGAQKNRWRLRQLAKAGKVTMRHFTGTDWAATDRDTIAEIERRSWVGQLDSGGDTKFLDPAARRFWEKVCEDPVLAAMIRGMVMHVGERPVAFTFGLDCGTTRYCIANGFDPEFAKISPGRILLYADFEAAWERGIRSIGWGLGDAGYKTEMGALPGCEMHDLLFVRNRLLAALIRPFWARG